MEKIWIIIVSLIILVGFGALALATRRMLRELRQDREQIRQASEPDPDVRVAGRLIEPELARYLAAHVYGRSRRLRFNPVDYPEQGSVKCLTCGHKLIGGQFFWDTPLLDRQTLEPVGKSFQICMSCQPGDVEAITHGQ